MIGKYRKKYQVSVKLTLKPKQVRYFQGKEVPERPASADATSILFVCATLMNILPAIFVIFEPLQDMIVKASHVALIKDVMVIAAFSVICTVLYLIGALLIIMKRYYEAGILGVATTAISLISGGGFYAGLFFGIMAYVSTALSVSFSFE